MDNRTAGIIDISKQGTMETKLKKIHEAINNAFPDAETATIKYHIKGGIEVTPIHFLDLVPQQDKQ